MRCSFCQEERPDGTDRCPKCGMKEEFAAASPTPETVAPKTKRYRGNPFACFARCMWKYFSVKGRATRRDFIWFKLVSTILWAALIVGAVFWGSKVFYYDFDDPDEDGAFCALVGFLVGAVLFLFPWITLVARRLHDIGLSGWYFFSIVAIQIALLSSGYKAALFASIIPFLLIFWPGTRGENEYGEDPREPRVA